MSDTYKIAYGDTPGELAEMVNSLMAEGWILQGGVAAAIDTTVDRGEPPILCLYQALVRPQPTEDLSKE